MTVKITEDMKFSPAFDYIDDGVEHGVLSPFETKKMILKKRVSKLPLVSSPWTSILRC